MKTIDKRPKWARTMCGGDHKAYDVMLELTRMYFVDTPPFDYEQNCYVGEQLWAQHVGLA